MSTSPMPPMPPQSLPPKRKRSTLTKLAIAFTVTIAVTFGLCTITLISSNSAMNGPVLPAAIIVEALCVIGLIVIAIMVIVRRFKKDS